MSFIVANYLNERGSVAWELPRNFEVAEYFLEIDKKYWSEPIEFVLIGHLNVYREYAPFRIVTSQEEFESVLNRQTGGRHGEKRR